MRPRAPSRYYVYHIAVFHYLQCSVFLQVSSKSDHKYMSNSKDIYFVGT